MKTPPSKPPPPKKEKTPLEQLESPLTCRAYFLGLSYLVQATGVESALTRGEIEAPPQELEIVPTYGALCVAYIKALRAVAELKNESESERLLREFNQSLS